MNPSPNPMSAFPAGIVPDLLNGIVRPPLTVLRIWLYKCQTYNMYDMLQIYLFIYKNKPFFKKTAYVKSFSSEP